MQSCLELIPDDIERVFVAYSGGLDSSVLLHLATRAPCCEVIAWHVNHGLLEIASQMERFCSEQAQTLGLKLRVDHLQLGEVGSNIEAEARRQRYHLFARNTGPGDCILTAHHADDQAETFLLNALRGSGSAGLRGIARQRMLGDSLLLRPLLSYSRAQLEDYANQHELPWFNDPSNKDLRFDRNYLRNLVVPLLRDRWPQFQHALSGASAIQAETQAVLDEIAAADFSQVKSEESAAIATLVLPKLLQLTPGRRNNLIRYWIAQAGFAPLPHARLAELLNQLHASADAQPEIGMPDYSLRLYDQRLFLVPLTSLQSCSGAFDFGLQTEIEIPQLERRWQRAEIFARIGVADADQRLSLKFRIEGEVNQDRHRLKRLFQSQRVPPWRRDRVPQVYLDGRLEGILP